MKRILAITLAILILISAMPFVHAEKSESYEVGDIIEFGSYPQSEVKDEDLIAELNALAPKWEEWTSYDYYSGDGNYGSMVPGDWMRYTDVTFEGEKYRGVKFTQYRPGGTFYTSSDTYNRCQYSNGYYVGTTYWFKFENIKWKIIDPDMGKVMSELLLDAQPYSNAIYLNPDAREGDLYAYFNDFEYSNYASDYETSSIRQWLNNDFYNLAFTDTAKEEISVSEVKDAGNSAVVISNTTYDKIYLLSYGETGGLGTRLENEEGIGHGKTQPTDYAKCQGGSNSDAWNLRGSGYSSYQNWLWLGGRDNIFMNLVYHVTNIRPVFSFGDASKLHEHDYELTYHKETELCTEGKDVFTCYCGAQYVEIINTHNYISVVTEPTCYSRGFTTYICACGDSYEDDFIAVTDHNDADRDYICDYCGEDLYKDNDAPNNCSHMCHKTGFVGFFWKIINFLQRIFGMNPVCECGAAHY